MDKALLIGIILPNVQDFTIDNQLSELSLLAKTANVKVVDKITQRLKRINPAFFVGKGKAGQIIDQASVLDVNIIIFDEELSPAQIKNFQKLSKSIKVIDRSALILDIFKKHAQTREAKTQVELAYCQYLLPRLTRQWTHLERQMGGVGTRAGMGETQIEIDRRLVRTKISKLNKDLKKIDTERTIQSQKRKTEFRVALVGYTNAGKSTLFNALTGDNAYVKDQLFATLDTTVRKFKLNRIYNVLLSDTVGFIRKLPHNLVASFRSTLKELLDADLILIVLDGSSNIIDEHLGTIKRVLSDLGAEKIPHSLIINKIDSVQNQSDIIGLKNTFPDAIFISALEHLKLGDIKSHIINKIEENFEIFDLNIPYHKGKIIAMLQNQVEILETDYRDEEIYLKVKANKNTVNKILY